MSQRITRAELYALPDVSNNEHDEQVQLMKWREWMTPYLPMLRWLWACPNGGLRTARTAGRLKAEGVLPGVCDLLLLYPSGGYHGLLIELKAAKGSLQDTQREFLQWHADRGYLAVCCKGWKAASAVIEWYIVGEDEPPTINVQYFNGGANA